MVNPTPLRTPAEDALLKRFPAEKATLPGDLSVHAAREAAWSRFTAIGLPHRRIEDWKYTDLRANVRAIAPAAGAADLARVAALAPAIPGDSARRIVVANGRLVPGLSDLADLPAGLTIRSLAEALAAGEAGLLETLPEADANLAVELNAAFVTDGVVVRIAAGVELDRPVEIAHVSDGASGVSTAVRNVVVVEAGAKATVIESVEATSAAAHQTNVVTVLTVADEAHLDHIRLQLEPVEALSLSTVVATIGRKAVLHTFNAALGAGIARAQVYARFAGREAVGGFRGVTMLSGRRHADTTLVVTHDAEACESRELYKAVIDDEARSVFQGRINVPSHAQKTDARMMTASLLLSEQAEANAKPELEIFADDVQCGHGATCGALDDDLMFYMLARGIPPVEAERMLILAFLGEAIDEIENEAVHDALIRRVEDWLEKRSKD